MNGSAITDLALFLRQRMQQSNISSTTLVFTFFCDVVTQQGGNIWLGSVIHALAPLGINERLTRTAVFRLVKDGWLESSKQGRRSYYRLTKTGQNYYQRSAKRIYASNRPEWDGVWTLLFVSLVPEDKRDSLHRGLSWLGYGRMAAGVYALPCDDRAALDELLSDLQLEDCIVQMKARADDTETLQKLVMSRWKLRNLRQRYEAFTTQYREVQLALLSQEKPTVHTLFLLRVLLVHEYRRILLNDPELPTEMLPADWEGYAAQSLTGEIYRYLALPTKKWANRELLNTDVPMKDYSNRLKPRFPKSTSTG